MSTPEIQRKREDIRHAEDRIAHFERLLRQRPRLGRLWTYWISWWRTRRADLLTDLYLEELRELKREVREDLPRQPEEQQIRRSEAIQRTLETIEDAITVILAELRDVERLATEFNWRIRYPRTYPTMLRWIHAIRGRIGPIRRWIRRIREELPQRWKNFVYVIYFAYTKPNEERHLEAHLEGICIDNPKVQEKVKDVAHRMLISWVTKEEYAMPLLPPKMEGPEGTYKKGFSEWEWGVEWHRKLTEYGETRPTEDTFGAKETQTLHFEVYDYDYGVVRREDYLKVPAKFWELPLEKLIGAILYGKYITGEEEE